MQTQSHEKGIRVTLPPDLARFVRERASVSGLPVTEEAIRALRITYGQEIQDGPVDPAVSIKPGAMAPDAAPLAADPASADLDADVFAACREYMVSRDIYNREHTEEDIDKCPLWARYEAARDAVSALTPQTFSGLAAKAKVAMHNCTAADGKVDAWDDLSLSWGLELMQDLIRLQGSMPAGAVDAALLADHRLYDDLERQWIATFDTDETPARARLQQQLRDMQEPILERIAQHRAASIEGITARLKTLLLEYQDEDFAAIAATPGFGLDERLTAILVRDLAGVLGVPLDDEASVTPGLDKHTPEGMLSVLLREIASASSGQNMADTAGLSAERTNAKLHWDKVRKLLCDREYDLLDAATLYRATNTDEAILALLNAGRLAEDFVCSEFPAEEVDKRQEMMRRCIYSALHPLMPLTADPDLVMLRKHFMPSYMDPLELVPDAADRDRTVKE